MEKDQTVKNICFGVAALVAIYVFFELLPYLVIFLALCGAWHLYQENERSNRHNHHNCHRRCNRRWWW